MARFEKLDTSKIELLNKKKCFLVKGTLTLDDVNKLNGLNNKIVLIFENTKGQNSDVIGYLNSDLIRVSIVGGLDYIHKQKYNSEEYIRRTIHTPKNIANVMKVFEGMERKIMFSWPESQKCMYGYKALCEFLNAFDSREPKMQNGCDYASDLTCLLYGKANCEGASLAFKEMMDRLGIECHYQSLNGTHSFNAVKFDGEYHGVDLFWDICNKSEDNKCGFNYYAREDGSKFYGNKYHNVALEKDEIRYSVVAMDEEKLKTDLTAISSNKREFSHEMEKYTNDLGESFSYTYLGESGGSSVFIVRQDENINYFYIDKNEDIKSRLSNDRLSIACYNNHNLSEGTIDDTTKRFSRYLRMDGSNFIVCPTGNIINETIREYTLLEPLEIDGKKVLKKSIILSENDLVGEKDPQVRKMIANYLLSKDRVADRIKRYNGYIGFVTSNTKNLFDREQTIEEPGRVYSKVA